MQSLTDKVKAAPFLLRLFLCLLCGMAIACALPPTYFVFGAFAGFGIFYILLTSFTPRASILAGWLFGFGYSTVGLYWIGNALLVEGNDYAWAWPLAVAGLPALLAFFTAAATYMVARFAALERPSGLIFFITAFALAEYLRGTILTGFPWNLYGYIWGDHLPIMQLLSLGGAYSLTLITLFWCSTIGFLILCNNKKQSDIVLTLYLLSFVLAYGFGAARLSQATDVPQENIALRVVQPNIAQQDKWHNDKINENFDILLSLTKSEEQTTPETKTLIIWPETATRSDMIDRDDYKNLLKKAMPENGFLLTGFLNREPQADGSNNYHNSLAVFDHNMVERDIYYKSHLVPFGEYIPFQKWIPLTPITSFTGFQAGAGPTTLSDDGLPPFSPLICYEILFPGHVKNADASAPEWIVNVTNDGWYGDSTGPYQHLVISRFRATEEGVPVVRSANTGISAVIDSYGQVFESLPLNTRGIIEAPLPSAIANRTLYSHFGNLIFLALLMGCGLLCFLCKKKKQ